eukprot:gene6613-7308_t
MKFKESHTFEERVKESERVRAKYPDRIPVICEKVETSSMEDLDKKKYLVPVDLTCGQLIYVIRKRLKFPSEKALFFFVNGSIPPNSATMSAVYDQHKDKDGFLYTYFGEENVFGHFSNFKSASLGQLGQIKIREATRYRVAQVLEDGVLVQLDERLSQTLGKNRSICLLMKLFSSELLESWMSYKLSVDNGTKSTDERSPRQQRAVRLNKEETVVQFKLYKSDKKLEAATRRRRGKFEK